MVKAVPGSLSEGAAERSEAEGVYFDERKHSKVSEFICAGGKSLARRNHRGTLPQSASLTAPSEREPGMGRVPFNRVLAKPEGCGRFSSPLRNSEVGRFHHSSGDTPSEREPGWGGYHSTCRSETGRVRAIFIAPTKGVFHSSGCSESGRGCTVQWRLSQSECKKVYEFIVAWEF